MDTVTLADAVSRLGELVDRALEGEPVRISRGDKLVELVALPAAPTPPEPKPPFDFEALRRLTDSMTGPVVDSEDFIRRFRDDARY